MCHFRPAGVLIYILHSSECSKTPLQFCILFSRISSFLASTILWTEMESVTEARRKILLHLGFLTGPKTAVAVAVTCKEAHAASPCDTAGLVQSFIDATRCPEPFAAGLIGLSCEDEVSVKKESWSMPAVGRILYVKHGKLVFKAQNGPKKFITWTNIVAVNGEVIPTSMPRLQGELLFMMMRSSIKPHIAQRLLYYLVRCHKTKLLREALRRLDVGAQLLGRVLLMVWLHESIIQRTCLDPENDDCRLLMEAGAVIDATDAVDVHFHGPYTDFIDHRVALFVNRGIYYQRLREHHPQRFRNWFVLRSLDDYEYFDFEYHYNEYEEWFPLQVCDYEKDDLAYKLPYDEDLSFCPNQWLYLSFHGPTQGAQFQCFSSNRTPPLGMWEQSRHFWHGQCGATLQVEQVNIDLWLNLFAHDVANLILAAEEVRKDWLARGWHFVTSNKAHQLREVLPWCTWSVQWYCWDYGYHEPRIWKK